MDAAIFVEWVLTSCKYFHLIAIGDISIAKEADHWEFNKIKRDDGTGVWGHPDMKCEVGVCANLATNANDKDKMNKKGNYQVSCKCS